MEIGNMIFAYHVPRGETKGNFERGDWSIQFLDRIDCDGYGFYKQFKDEDDPLRNERGGITTELFEINPYYCGKNDDEFDLPNFIFKPSNYSLMWYKYPLRDSYANQELTFSEFSEMLKKCEEYYEDIKSGSN